MAKEGVLAAYVGALERGDFAVIGALAADDVSYSDGSRAQGRGALKNGLASLAVPLRGRKVFNKITEGDTTVLQWRSGGVEGVSIIRVRLPSEAERKMEFRAPGTGWRVGEHSEFHTAPRSRL
eukprot:Hpha_TRINITY_DN14438_c0_g1::TRINITY_DN14438_c0_g1_i1::g.157737::m.157737